MRKSILTILLTAAISVSFAQVDMAFFKKAATFQFGGGMVFPGEDMKSTKSTGLYADNGFQLSFDLNFMSKIGLGGGLNVEYDQFLLNKTAFMNATKPLSMEVEGGYSSTKVGLNVMMNIPLVVSKNKFAINMYGELNPGVRGFKIPSIDLHNDETVFKYVEVSYRSRKNYMAYVGYSGGLQFLFNEKWGINLSYNALFRTRHSIDYSVRMFDAFGNLYEGEEYLNNYLDHSGWQLGLVFVMGKK